MIVVDAAAVPDRPSGERTRLRGLYGAYARLDGAPPVTVFVARGSRLFDGVECSSSVLRLSEVPPSGGPWARSLRPWRRQRAAASCWHTETIPPLGPRNSRRLLTLHDLRWQEKRAVAGGTPIGHAMRHLAARYWLPRLVRSLSGVVTVSAATRAEIHRRLGVPHERIHLVENASAGLAEAPVEEARCRELLERLDVFEPFLLSVGHLERRKGLDLVLSALAEAAPESAAASLQWVVVGGGPDRAALERLARSLGVAGRVRFVGVRSDEEVRALMQRCLALVFPSRLEGFGFPVFEALGRGCPVLSTPLDCLSELTDAGLIRAEADANLWARKIQWVFHHRDELRAETEARPASSAVTTWERSAEKLAAVYEGTEPRR